MSLPEPRRALATALGLFLIWATPVAAQADTFFVSKSGSGTECSEGAPCATISQALTSARAAGGTGDRIEVGPGLYEERVVINDANDAGLTLHGAGRGPDQEATPHEATTVRSPETNKGDEVAISVASGVLIESLRVEVPAGFVNTAGIELGGPAATARDVHVESAGGINTGAIEVAAKTPEAKILNARVRHIGDYWGIAIFGPGATVADSDVRTAQGQALDTEFGFAETTQVVRSRFETAGGTVATIRSPDVEIDSSLLTGGSIGVEAYANFGDVNLVTLSNDTIDVGEPKVDDHSGVAAKARAETEATASITLINSVAVEKQEVEGSASQTVTCKESVVPLQEENGPKGEIECGAGGRNVFAPPSALFASGADWHLLPGSVAVDTGSEGDALTSTDLDGSPRVVDGNGDGSAVIDRGAYELPTPVPAANAPTSPSNAFKFGKLKRNKRKGTAKLQVEVPGPGRLVLTGKKVKKSSLDAKRAGTFALKIVPKSKLARQLKSKGAAHVSVKVAFTPSDGTTNTRTRSLKLIRTG